MGEINTKNFNIRCFLGEYKLFIWFYLEFKKAKEWEVNKQ